MILKSDDVEGSAEQYAEFSDNTMSPERFNNPLHTWSDHYHDYFLNLHCNEAIHNLDLLMDSGCTTDIECQALVDSTSLPSNEHIELFISFLPVCPSL